MEVNAAGAKDLVIDSGELTYSGSTGQSTEKALATLTEVSISVWLDYEFIVAEAGISSGPTLTGVDAVPAYGRVLSVLVGVRDSLQTAAPDLNIYINAIRFEASLADQCLVATTLDGLLDQSLTCAHR